MRGPSRKGDSWSRVYWNRSARQWRATLTRVGSGNRKFKTTYRLVKEYDWK